jgi:hypothetical protein
MKKLKILHFGFEYQIKNIWLIIVFLYYPIDIKDCYYKNRCPENFHRKKYFVHKLGMGLNNLM